MTARMYYDDDADPSALAGQTVAIIGYGSQGHAHALNLHESGRRRGGRAGDGSKSRALAEEAGLRVLDVADAVKAADVIMILVPDTAQKAVYDAEIGPNLRPGQLLMFAHGFNIHFKRIDAARLRRRRDGRAQGSRPPGSQRLPGRRRRAGAVRRPPGRVRHRPCPALAYARALGNTRAGVLETTFAEETETDLFGEQSVLCGGTAALVKMAFETLVGAGYQPELAYFETMHELKLIVDLMYRGGLNFMRFSVSDTAEYGDYVSGPADHRRPRPGDDAGRPHGHPGRQRSRRAGSPRATRAGPSSSGCAPPIGTTRSSRSGARLRAQMPFLNPVEVAGRSGPGGRHDPGSGKMSAAPVTPRPRRRSWPRARSASSTPRCATASRRRARA